MGVVIHLRQTEDDHDYLNYDVHCLTRNAKKYVTMEDLLAHV